MCLVKTIKVNDISINIHDDYIPKNQNEYKEKLKIVYDTINMIFCEKNRADLFFTNDELIEIKNKKEYEFI